MASDGGQLTMSGRPTRERIVDEAMRLFGEQGYAATSVADIEAAAGLSSGSGGLYRHFASKKALLEAGVRGQIEVNPSLLDQLASAPTDQPLVVELTALGHAGIRRLVAEQDLNRLVVRDLRHFPDLLAQAADGDLRPVLNGLARWLAQRDQTGELDAAALAAVVAGATTSFWLLSDVFGEHPSGVSEERYVAALVRLLGAVLAPEGTATVAETDRTPE